MSRPDVAVRVPLPDIASDTTRWAGRKVRTVGILTAVDAPSSIGTLTWEKHVIIVDLSLCMEGSVYLPRIKTKIDCIGDLEEADEALVGQASSLRAGEGAVAHTSDSRMGGAEETSSDDEQLKWEPPTGSVPERRTAKDPAIASIVLKCIYFREADDLDVRLWNDAARLLQSHHV